MTRSIFLATAGFAYLAGFSPVNASVPRLALHVDSDGTATSVAVDQIRTILTGRLLRSGKFEVVDRARLDSVIREQGFSNSAYADPATAAALGKLTGASRILNVTLSIEISDAGGAMLTSHQVVASASFTMVGVDTARVVSAGSAQGVGERQTPAGAASTASEPQLEREALKACSEDLVSQLLGLS